MMGIPENLIGVTCIVSLSLRLTAFVTLIGGHLTHSAVDSAYPFRFLVSDIWILDNSTLQPARTIQRSQGLILGELDALRINRDGL